VFGVFLTAMALHFYFFFPETAGKTLEEVEDMFLSGVPAWKTHVTYKKARQHEQGSIDRATEKYGSVNHNEHRSDSEHTAVDNMNTFDGNERKGQNTADVV
jgi:hypothetical protein